MKKTALKLLLILLVMGLLCGCGTVKPVETTDPPTAVTIVGDLNEVEETESTEPTEDDSDEVVYLYDYTMKSFFEYSDCYEYIPIAYVNPIKDGMDFFHAVGDGTFTVGQGSASDGKYAYLFLSSGTDEAHSQCFKVDLETWEVVKKSEALPVEHANGVTYNSKINKLVVAHCQPTADAISIVNPDTLTVEQTLKISNDIQSITYNASHNLYAARVSGSWDLVLLNENFEQVKYIKGVDSKLGKQCIYCDDDYIYSIDSGVIAKPGTEALVVYDWNGNYVGVYKVDSMVETESMFEYNGDYYMVFYQGGARVFKLNFDKSLLGG